MGRHRVVGDARPAGFADVLRDRLFATLFAAETQSIVGDQFARVALSVLVYERTGSAPATAATYAATLLPAILGGLLLSRLGDRLPRRVVMVACDLLRAACFGCMAIPGLPLAPVIGLVVFAVAFGPVFSAAQVSLLASHLSPERFRAGNGLRMVAAQGAQVGGFVSGGVIVAFCGPRLTLLLDAATFVVSALLVGVVAAGTRLVARPPGAEPARPMAEPVSSSAPTGWPSASSLVFRRDRRFTGLVALALLAGFFVVPEGLAVPFGDSVGASTFEVGLLFGSAAAGGAIGAVLIVRLRFALRREALTGWLAVCCGVPLVVTAVTPPWWVAAACWFVSGLFAAYMVEATTLIVQSIPDERRAHLVGVIGSLLLASQGAGLIGFGALSYLVPPGVAIALAGAAGSAVALVVLVGMSRRRVTTELEPRVALEPVTAAHS